MFTHGCAGSLMLCVGFLRCGLRASPRSGFSCWGAQGSKMQARAPVMAARGAVASDSQTGWEVVARRLSCPAACGILVPWLGVTSMSPALEDRSSTTGPPGKSLDYLFNYSQFWYLYSRSHLWWNISLCFNKVFRFNSSLVGASLIAWKWKSLSPVWLSVTPWTPWNSLGQNTEVGSYFLLQGIFPTQGSNLGLLNYRQIFYQLNQIA